MYVFLLCRKYLSTRYIALASVVSVLLGVATMIVVNSVMKGFAVEMQARIHGVLSDVVFEAQSLEGFVDAQWHMNEIRKAAGEYIEGMTPTVVVPAMLSYKVQRQWVTQPVQLIGIDARTQSQASDFGQFLQHPDNRKNFSFNLREAGYDTQDGRRASLAEAGWGHRRDEAAFNHTQAEPPDNDPLGLRGPAPSTSPNDGAAASSPYAVAAGPTNPAPQPKPAVPQNAFEIAQAEAVKTGNPFPAAPPSQNTFDPAKQQHSGLVLGIALASYQDRAGQEQFLVMPGDDVRLTLPAAGTPPRAIDDLFTVTDFYECKMSEYDSQFVFVPIEKLQKLRGMIDPQTGNARVTSIQIKLKNDADGIIVRDKLKAVFHPQLYRVSTWRDKQGALLAAVQMETAILNVLLFLIIAVAGFGILAIFFMIVVEKTKDIGILKSLGASSRGIMGIFLAYGLSLGAVGAGGGLITGLAFVHYINEIADVLSHVTGRKVFDPSIYYFYKIPTIVDPATVAMIVVGALGIAVGASILPALRAARMHPVEALRYD
ncbi:MAG: FtsX-like permease family protein [Planctomycetia bacterium]|nr:FtsX-like permease family protein [Planctomycetia bacterium]